MMIANKRRGLELLPYSSRFGAAVYARWQGYISRESSIRDARHVDVCISSRRIPALAAKNCAIVFQESLFSIYRLPRGDRMLRAF